jgi:branched-chain amino acid transport system permease protein
MLLRSPFGHSLIAIRENERRARFLGIPVEEHIWLSFIVSGLFASLAGALFALLNNFADPHSLRWDQSGVFVIMVVLGGMRSFFGPLIGAAIFVVLQDYLSSDSVTYFLQHAGALLAQGLTELGLGGGFTGLIANVSLCHADGSCLTWETFIGLLFVLIVLFFPRGVLGILGRRALP